VEQRREYPLGGTCLLRLSGGYLTRAPKNRPYTMRAIAYGLAESQAADLYVPRAVRPPVVCLLHGGFWRMPFDRAQFDPVARDLATRGFAVWNLEYRRLGAPSGGWPATFHDVAAGVDHLASLVAEGAELDLSRVIVVGHSAGGHLALWSAARGRHPSLPRTPSRVKPVATAGLAAIVDLARTFALGAGNGAVAELLGGSPDEHPARYAAASPMALLPLGVPHLIVHGIADEALPVETARDYVRAATAAGDSVEFVALPRAGHMDYLDPGSEAHHMLCRWLERLTG
jgi:acetyl esterase/lipase